MVDLRTKGIIVEILLDSFYKWMSFDEKINNNDREEVEKILENSKEIEFGPLSRDYIDNPKIREKFDKIKKEIGYNY